MDSVCAWVRLFLKEKVRRKSSGRCGNAGPHQPPLCPSSAWLAAHSDATVPAHSTQMLFLPCRKMVKLTQLSRHEMMSSPGEKSYDIFSIIICSKIS